jgi:hypothetical protein
MSVYCGNNRCTKTREPLVSARCVKQITGHCAAVGLYNVWAWGRGGCCGCAVMAGGLFVVRDFSVLKARELLMDVSPLCIL